MPKIVCLDTETTGTGQDDRIIELAYMVFDSDDITMIYFSGTHRYKPPVPISIGSMVTHGITPEDVEMLRMISEYPEYSPDNYVHNLETWNKSENFVVGHNVQFDLDMLAKEGFMNQMQIIDTMNLSKHMFKDMEHYSLQWLNYAFRLDKTNDKYKNIDAHSAMGDVIVCYRLFSKLLMSGSHTMESLVALSAKPIILDKVNFGKYQGRMIVDIMNEDFQYIQWYMRQVEKDSDMERSFLYWAAVLKLQIFPHKEKKKSDQITIPLK